MPGPTFLRGERVSLAPIEEEDLPFLRETINHPDVWRTIRAAAPVNAEQERDWWESLDDREGETFLIVADEEPVGTVGFGDVDPNWGTAEVGYSVHPDHWNSGYATAAVELLAEYAFGERRLAKLYATVYDHNPASMRVLEKVGFEREAVLEREAYVGGERVDLHRYGLLEDEWSGTEHAEE